MGISEYIWQNSHKNQLTSAASDIDVIYSNTTVPLVWEFAHHLHSPHIGVLERERLFHPVGGVVPAGKKLYLRAVWVVVVDPEKGMG